MEDTLIQTGLTRIQAKTYLYLLEHGATAPPTIAEALQLTRSNAYKILDSLAERNLARRVKTDKKFVYQAEDPTALTELVGEARNHAMTVEHAAKSAIEILRDRYKERIAPLTTQTYSGKTAVVALYEQHAHLKEPTYYIKSPFDITYIGFETLARLRHLPAKLGGERYGITPDNTAGSVSPDLDTHTHLHRTWVDADEYRAPVEWSVSGDELHIYVFDNETYALNIKSKVVADAFQELWQLLDKSLRLRPDYTNLPKRAKRTL